MTWRALRKLLIAFACWGAFLALVLLTRSKILGVAFFVSVGFSAILAKVISLRRPNGPSWQTARSRFMGLCIALSICAGVAAFLWAEFSSSGPGMPDDNFPLARTVDDPADADARSVDLLHADDLRFVMGDGSGLHGYNVTKIGPDGNCEYTFFEWVAATNPNGDPANTQKWRRAVFSVKPEVWSDLRKLLVEIEFLNFN